MTLSTDYVGCAPDTVLRGYDAVHLACGLLVKQQLLERGLPAPVLLSSDAELLQATPKAWLAIDDPNTRS